jgi:glycosyltransferase involved in cell wall biosynthesis
MTMTQATSRPLVSVVIPAYNRAATIGATLDSIMSQEGWPFEVVVVDDGSTDGTAAVARRHAPAARVVEQPNQRRSAARNNGARLAAGECLYFFDSDDLMEPGAIARLAACLEKHPEAAIAYGPVLEFADDPAAAAPRRPFFDAGGDLLRTQIEAPFLIPIMTLVRREWFERAGGFSPRLDFGEDYHFFLKVAALGGRFQCAGGAPLARYREYGGPRMPGSRHARGMLTALEILAEEFGDRLPLGLRLDRRIARERAGYARHLLREGRRFEAWRAWLPTLPYARPHRLAETAIFLASTCMSADDAERRLSGIKRRLRGDRATAGGGR